MLCVCRECAGRTKVQGRLVQVKVGRYQKARFDDDNSREEKVLLIILVVGDDMPNPKCPR